MFFQKSAGPAVGMSAGARVLFLGVLLVSGLAGFSGCDNPENDGPRTKNSGKAITRFAINGAAGVIDGDAKTITVVVPYTAGFNPAALSPSLTLSDKAAVSPAPGTAADLSKPAVYTVTAEDGDTAEYTITVWALFDYAANGINLLSAYLERAPEDYNSKDDPYYIALTGFDFSIEVSGLKSFSAALHEQFVHLDLSRCTGESIPEAYYMRPGTGGHSSQTSYVESAVSVILPNNLKELGGYIFGSTKALARVELPPTLETIGPYAFSQTGALKTLDFPSSLKTIDERVFFHSSIETAVLPEGLTTIKHSAFEASNLKSITLPSTLSGALATGLFSACTALETVEIPASARVTGPLSSTFYDCRKLKAINLPPTVSGSVDNAFFNCSSLTSLDLSQTKVTLLGINALQGCSALETLALPATLTQIGTDNSGSVNPLGGCVKLSTLILYADVPPMLAQYGAANALSATAANLIIYVPPNSVRAYKEDSRWSAYADHIKSLSEMPQ